ncbi:hypothetical protein FH972_023906 [Carpinus fangiana]|uniref:Peptidase M20 dimerisation domain-containing protein n=1 Tax=Carpinus fangiana TaxID=176857 RepID=A0A5N6KXB1_9ROSI|nr:hypothetical protein FH972_023906 [Carpinus fangiana]
MTRIVPVTVNPDTELSSTNVPTLLDQQPRVTENEVRPIRGQLHVSKNIFRDIVSQHRPKLDTYETLYKHIHANPCLSFVEDETASLVVSTLKRLQSPSFTIKQKIGKTGVVAILRNGPGPTVLLRADMDALPVEEKTGLPYASKKYMKDANGVTQPAMHACGHDMHVTSLLAAAHTLHSARSAWCGTLLCCFQPAEEKGGGAQGMIDDGLYDPHRHAVPEPDVVLGGHVFPHRAGTLTTRQGIMMAASDSLQITFHGRGGHASQPQSTVDPVIMAASAVMRLQTVVSREVAPQDPAVLTIASIHAGSAENIISDTAVIKTNVRTYDPTVAAAVKKSIARIVRAEADASGAKEPPTVEVLGAFPVTRNEPGATATVQKAFTAYFGAGDPFKHKKGYIELDKPLAGSEDFATLGTAIGKPTCFWIYGGHDPEDWDKRVKEGTTGDLPSNHSPYFAPSIQPTLETAVDAFCVAALGFFGKDRSKIV